MYLVPLVLADNLVVIKIIIDLNYLFIVNGLSNVILRKVQDKIDFVVGYVVQVSINFLAFVIVFNVVDFVNLVCIKLNNVYVNYDGIQAFYADIVCNFIISFYYLSNCKQRLKIIVGEQIKDVDQLRLEVQLLNVLVENTSYLDNIINDSYVMDSSICVILEVLIANLILDNLVAIVIVVGNEGNNLVVD